METERLVPPAVVAEHLDVSQQYLASMRYLGTGPRFIKIGQKVRYRMSDVDAWLTAQTKTQSGVAS